MKNLLSIPSAVQLPCLAMASEPAGSNRVDMTNTGVVLFAIAIFLIAYQLVMAEEFTHLCKPKPVIYGASIYVYMLVNSSYFRV